ncbi:VOC family protein [Myxococcota bacterium]|nr:VOC family protein [Myxococcota bacterium]
MASEATERQTVGSEQMALDIFKTALIVEDIESAMRDLGNGLKLEWTPVQHADLTLRLATGDEQVPLRFVFSLGSPPYLELLQAQPTGYYAAPQGGYLHHLGIWVDDLATASKGLADQGMPLEAAGVEDGLSPAVFAFHTTPHGLRLELAEASRREGFEKWLAGGELQI